MAMALHLFQAAGTVSSACKIRQGNSETSDAVATKSLRTDCLKKYYTPEEALAKGLAALVDGRIEFLFPQCQQIDLSVVFTRSPPARFEAVSSLAHVRDNAYCSLCALLWTCIAYHTRREDQNPARMKLFAVRTLSAFSTSNPRLLTDVVHGLCLTITRKLTDVCIIVGPIASTGEPLPTIGAQPVPPLLDYAHFRSLLAFCDSSRQRICQLPSYVRMYKLLAIDCAGRKIVDLHASDQLLTLSYLWGANAADATDPPLLPTIAPTVIEDVPQVALQLGCRYLWVDRYCIPQNDPAEKQRQLRNLGKIWMRLLSYGMNKNPSWSLDKTHNCRLPFLHRKHEGSFEKVG